MTRNTLVTPEPVVLEGYQAIMTPSKFGYSLGAIIGQDIVDQLEDDRTESLKWAESKLKNPKRSVLKPEPWEEVTAGQYKVKFSWNEDTKPPVVDTDGTVITDERLPIYSGSKVGINNTVEDLTYNLEVSGSIRASNAILSNSDERLKENILNIENPLSKVSNIDGVYFNWK